MTDSHPRSLSEIALRRATGNRPPALVAKALDYVRRLHDTDLSLLAKLTDDEIDQLRRATFEVQS